MTPQKHKNVKHVLQHDEYRLAFEALLDIPAILKEGVELGTWHKVAGLRCDEVSREPDILI